MAHFSILRMYSQCSPQVKRVDVTSKDPQELQGGQHIDLRWCNAMNTLAVLSLSAKEYLSAVV